MFYERFDKNLMKQTATFPMALRFLHRFMAIEDCASGCRTFKGNGTNTEHSFCFDGRMQAKV